MAIKNKFIHFNTEAGFKNYLLTGNGSGGGFLNTEGTNFEENIYSVKPEKQEDWNLFKNYTCFIKDTQRIWTHEKFYNCDTSNYFNINRGEITDANNINNIGMYTFTSDTQNIPSEMSGSGIILTYASTVSPDNFIQMCTGFKNGTPTSWYIRSKTGTNSWSNWSKLLDDRNLTKLSQLEDDIVNGKYLPLTGGDVSGIINLTSPTARIRVSGTDLLSYVTSDGSTRLARNVSGDTYIGNIGGEMILYATNLTFYDGSTRTVWHSGNFNPASKADLSLSFVSKRGSINEADLNEFSIRSNGTYSVVRSGSHDLLVVFQNTEGSTSALEFYCDYDNNLQFRIALDNNRYVSFKKIWHSSNLNPVTIDSDQIITGWKRFTPKTKNGVYNTSGIIGDKDVYGTPISWNVDSNGSFWHIQQYSNTIALIGVQNGKPFQIRSTPDEISVTADKFNGTATQIQDSSDNSSKKIWTGTQSEYNAISSKDANTIYLITE